MTSTVRRIREISSIWKARRNRMRKAQKSPSEFGRKNRNRWRRGADSNPRDPSDFYLGIAKERAISEDHRRAPSGFREPVAQSASRDSDYGGYRGFDLCFVCPFEP